MLIMAMLILIMKDNVMKNYYVSLAILIMFLAASCVENMAAVPKNKNNWLSDIGEAKVRAAKSTKPVFIFFSLPDPAQKLTVEFLMNASFQAALADYITVKVEDAKIAAEHGINMTGFVILNSRGEEVVRSDTKPFLQPLLQMMKYANACLSLEANKNDVDALYVRGRYAMHFLPSEQAFEQIEAGLKVLREDDTLRRARLLFSKGITMLRADSTSEEAVALVKRAKDLDPDNKAAIQEDADFYVIKSNNNDVDYPREQLLKEIDAYFKKYPVGAIKDETVRYEILDIQFMNQMLVEDYQGALRNLELQKKFAVSEKIAQRIEVSMEKIKDLIVQSAQ